MMIDTAEPSSFPILQTMLKQEESCYKIHDYFLNLPSEDLKKNTTIDAGARQEIAQWCMNIMEICHNSKEFAAVTMSCLDRFVSTSEGREVLLDKSQYQLAALTALYFSAKIHCPQALPPDLVAKLSHGSMYGGKDIEAMERRMLNAIQWRVNPPTTMDFVRIYLDMIIAASSKTSNNNNNNGLFDQPTQDMIIELTGYSASSSVLQFDIATEKVSHVAVASLLNALESIYTDDQDFCNSIYHFISRYTDIDSYSIGKLQRKLHKSTAIAEHTTSKEQIMKEQEKPSRNFSVDNRSSIIPGIFTISV